MKKGMPIAFLLMLFSCKESVQKAYNPDGSLRYEYEMKSGVRHGVARFYGDKGEYLNGTEIWVNGKCDGPSLGFNRNGDTIFKGYAIDSKCVGASRLFSTNKKLKMSSDLWDGKLAGWVNMYDTVFGDLIEKQLLLNRFVYSKVINFKDNKTDFYFDVLLPDTLQANETHEFKLKLYNYNTPNRHTIHFKFMEEEANLFDWDADSTWNVLSSEVNTITFRAGEKGYNRLLGVIQVNEFDGDTMHHFKYPVVKVYFAR